MRETLEVKKECDMDKPHSYRRYEYSRREDGRTASENIAVVDIFVKDPYYTSNKRDVAVPFTTFVANSGRARNRGLRLRRRAGGCVAKGKVSDWLHTPRLGDSRWGSMREAAAVA